MLVFNFNMPVTVNVKQHGREILAKLNNDKYQVDENGELTMSMYDVMKVFGPYMPGYGPLSHANITPISGDIKVSEEDLEEYSSRLTEEEYKAIKTRLGESSGSNTQETSDEEHDDR